MNFEIVVSHNFSLNTSEGIHKSEIYNSVLFMFRRRGKHKENESEIPLDFINFTLVSWLYLDFAFLVVVVAVQRISVLWLRVEGIVIVWWNRFTTREFLMLISTFAPWRFWKDRGETVKQQETWTSVVFHVRNFEEHEFIRHFNFFYLLILWT